MNNIDTHLQWVNFATHVCYEAFDCYKNEIECDVTIKADNQSIQAHKIVLSTASDYIREILQSIPVTEEKAVIIFPDIKFPIIKWIVEFIYKGETEIPTTNLNEFLEICNLLELKSITGNSLKIFDSQIINPDDVIEYDDSSCIISTYENSEVRNYITEYSDKVKVSNEQQIFEAHKHQQETTPSVSGIKPKRTRPKQKAKRPKKYSDHEKLQAAVEAVGKGKTFRETANIYQIPLSTLYAYTKQKHQLKRNARPSLYDKSRIQEAVDAILYKRLSYKKAEEYYNIPKTILWRHVKKMTEIIDVPINPRNETKIKAIRELENGKSLSEVCKKFNIAVSTLYREKRKLYIDGKLDTSFVKTYKKGSDFKAQVQLAVEACQKGLSQGIAACLYNIPKTTIWRHLKKYDTNNIGSIESETTMKTEDILKVNETKSKAELNKIDKFSILCTENTCNNKQF